MLTGGFRKQLLRKYGTTFKYFIGAELGDGKGSRGMHNNPHYHVLFFLENANNEKFPYKVITPDEFRHLVRMYWQGFDEDVDKQNGIFHDYRTDCRYGIAKEGENLGKVTDFRACMYCAKYVCKDVQLKQYESKIERKLRFKYSKDAEFIRDCQKTYFYFSIYPLFNIPRNAKHTEWVYSERSLIEHLLGADYFCGDELFAELDFLEDCPIAIFKVAEDIIAKYHLEDDFHTFFVSKLDEKVHIALTEYRNRYCNKCRISHGVGDYALEFIEDKMNPFIKIPSKKGFKNRPINMYYYRKLYTDVYKDSTGSNIRVLNQLGIDYKVNRLRDQIKKMSDKALANLRTIINSPALFEKMKQSDVNVNVFFSYGDLLDELSLLLSNNYSQNFLQKYAEYKLVYEDRYFKVDNDRVSEFGCFPDIDVFGDYRRFLSPSYFSVSRSDLRLDSFLESDTEDWMAYWSHPYFLRYSRIFAVLDLCADYFFIQADNQDQRKAEERAAIKRFHDKGKLVDFYSRFKVA